MLCGLFAFSVLLQDLINGLLGCFSVEDFLLDGIILREDDPFVTEVSQFLSARSPLREGPDAVLEFSEIASVFDLSFNEDNLDRFLCVLNGLPVFADFNSDLTAFLDKANSFNFSSQFVNADPSDFRDVVLENIPNSLLSILRLEFSEILDNSCNIELSTEQEEAVLDLFEVDVRAVILAAVECNLVELETGCGHV